MTLDSILLATDKQYGPTSTDTWENDMKMNRLSLAIAGSSLCAAIVASASLASAEGFAMVWPSSFEYFDDNPGCSPAGTRLEGHLATSTIGATLKVDTSTSSTYWRSVGLLCQTGQSISTATKIIGGGTPSTTLKCPAGFGGLVYATGTLDDV